MVEEITPPAAAPATGGGIYKQNLRPELATAPPEKRLGHRPAKRNSLWDSLPTRPADPSTN
eukprot:3015236-Lingulodinium_polyedra.AAC.1